MRSRFQAAPARVEEEMEKEKKQKEKKKKRRRRERGEGARMGKCRSRKRVGGRAERAGAGAAGGERDKGRGGEGRGPFVGQRIHEETSSVIISPSFTRCVGVVCEEGEAEQEKACGRKKEKIEKTIQNMRKNRALDDQN